MGKRIQLVIVAWMLLGSAMSFGAKPTAVLGAGRGSGSFRVPYHEPNAHRILSADTVYFLTGWYFIDSTNDITIPAGTVIRGDSASAGSMIIKRGAQGFFNGTDTRPVIFTSQYDAGHRAPGDWGGLIILGNAPINQPYTTQVEGGFGTIPNSDASYGGPDPNASSGSYTYLRVEYAGVAFAQDNEINGITLGGVGRGTVFQHIQSSYANDDAIEWFGGTVDPKYIICIGSVDDVFDTDFGFSGRQQFCLGMRDPAYADRAVASGALSSNGFESDNNNVSATKYAGDPHTYARYSNITLIGPQQHDTGDVVDSHFWNEATIRRASGININNSILMGWRRGILFRNDSTAYWVANDTIIMHNNIIQATNASQVVYKDQVTDPSLTGFDVNAWFFDSAKKNYGGAINIPEVGLNNPVLGANVDPRPAVGSMADTGGTDFTGKYADPVFDHVNYRGAFDPHLPRNQQWDAGWANYDPQHYDPEASIDYVDGWNMVSNPFYFGGDRSVSELFPTATSAAFGYNNGYVSASSLTHGSGYWVKMTGASYLPHVAVNHTYGDTIQLAAKWNLIGSFADTISVDSLHTTTTLSSYYGYSAGYTVATQIIPGRAYWVKAADPASLTVGYTSNAPKMNPMADLAGNGFSAITVSDKSGAQQALFLNSSEKNTVDLSAFELPPAPPAGAFDARFSSQRMAEYLNGGVTINVQSNNFPLTVSLGSTIGQVEVLQMSNGSVVEKGIVNGSIEVKNASVDAIVIRQITSNTAPKAFALGQNYPNPFNPVTRFSFDVPKDAPVEIAVFDILGQKVATLMTGVATAGTHTLEWNATNAAGVSVPSGVYFVRMQAGGFNALTKVILMK